jgi:hypothetical protein
MMVHSKHLAAIIVSRMKKVLHDRYMFPLFEAVLVGLFFYAVCPSRQRKPVSGLGLTAIVDIKISAHARALLYGFYTAFAVVVFNIPLRVKTSGNYKVFWILLNLSIVAYLCFFNTWFRFELLRWASAFENKIDRF